MGIVSGMVNTPDQPAAEIVHEIVVEAEALLTDARKYHQSQSRL